MIFSRTRASGPVAAVTMVRNEGAVLRRWIDHYAGQVGMENLLVIDDNSDDGSTEGLPCAVKRIAPISGHFELERMKIVSGEAERLLKGRSAVVFADADEFVVADPARHQDLTSFVRARAGVAASGVVALNVVHHTATEPPLDLSGPLLRQRSLAKFVPLLCKPSLKQVRNPWAAASHGIQGVPYALDPELFMFHFKFADRDLLAATADHRRRMVEMDGRAKETSWRFNGDEMVDLLDRMNADAPADPATVEEFSPKPKRLDGIVQSFDNGVTRATGQRQVQAMEKRPFRRIPERFLDAV